MSRPAGRRVSMAPNRIRRSKRDSSFAGTEEEPGGFSGRHKNAIFNDEIARLLIREEDLIKVSQEARAETASADLDDRYRRSIDYHNDSPGEPSYRRVAVRREIPESERQPPLRQVVLLRRTTSDASATTAGFRYSSGPRLDSRGRVVAHSLLGRPEEFYRMGLLRGHLRPEDVPQEYRSDEAIRGVLSAVEAAIGPQRVDPQHSEDSSAATGSAVFRWSPEQTSYGLPALETEDTVGVRRLGSKPDISGLSMRRLTEQVNQCGFVSPMKHLTDSCTDWEAVWRRSPSARTPTPATGRGLKTPGGGDTHAASGDAARSVVKLSGPQYSFIGGWTYQKEVLLG